jgi:peptide/nickel transport system substrate-binding protein
MRKCLCAGAMLALMVVLGGCGSSKGQASNATSDASGSSKPYAELRWGSAAWPGPLNTTNNTWAYPASIESLVVQNLVEFESSGNAKPGPLTSSIEHPNPTTYVYNLKQDAKFSDGKPVTVGDVLFSLNRNIHGKEAVWTGVWNDVSSVSARGSHAVVIKLERPDAVWADVMGFTSQVIEKAQAERVGEKALGTPGNMPIGSGPWKFDSYQPEASVHLSRNPYWTGAPQPAEKITITIFKSEATMALALRSGAIDGAFSLLSPKTFANIPGIRHLTASGSFLAMFQINTTRAPFNDVHVRRAIAYATDTKGMINALYPGTAVEDPTISPTSLFSGLGTASQVNEALNTLPKYNFDLAAAKRELAQSAYPHGFTTKVQALSGEPGMVAAAQILVSDLAKIGVKASVQELANDAEGEIYNNKMTILANEYYSVYPDPEGLISSLLPPSEIRPPGAGLNDANYRNSEVDKLLPEELEAVNPTRRLQLITKLLKAEGSDVPYVPLFTHDMLGALSEKYVFPKFSNWTVLFTPWALNVKSAH